jgi:hypothetical protein
VVTLAVGRGPIDCPLRRHIRLDVAIGRAPQLAASSARAFTKPTASPGGFFFGVLPRAAMR